MKEALRKLLPITYILGILGVLSILHSWHYLDLTQAKDTPLLANFEGEGLGLLHVLGEGCGCSHFTAEYLEKRGPKKGLREVVYYLTKNAKQVSSDEKSYIERIKKAGFPLIIKELPEMKDVDILGVPFLQVYSSKGELLHSGGYSNKMITRTTPFFDLKIIEQIAEKKDVGKNPVFGCITSKSYQIASDPIGLKY